MLNMNETTTPSIKISYTATKIPDGIDQQIFVNESNLSFEISGDEGIAERFQALLTPHELVRFILAAVSILLNVVILLALGHARKRISTHYQLVVSLAVSDTLVGLSVVLHYFRKIFSPVYPAGTGPYIARLTSVCLHVVFKSLNTIGLNVNLMNLMTISCDHYVAILWPLQYHIIMTKTRIRRAIVGIWICAVILGLSDFFSGIPEHWKYKGFTYCEVVRMTIYQEEFTVFVIAVICLGIIVYVYTRIYVTVRKHQAPGQENRRDRHRHTKALITTLLNIMAFIVSWLPLCIFEVTLIIKAKTDPFSLMDNEEKLIIANYHLYNLLIMHAIADPIIYTVRMKEVQLGFEKMFPCCKGCLYSPKRRQATLRTSVRSSGEYRSHRNLNTTTSLMSDTIPLTHRHSPALRSASFNTYPEVHTQNQGNIAFRQAISTTDIV